MDGNRSRSNLSLKRNSIEAAYYSGGVGGADGFCRYEAVQAGDIQMLCDEAKWKSARNDLFDIVIS